MSQIVLRFGSNLLAIRQVGPQIHDFTGLPLTANGFTDFKAMYQHEDRYNDSRIVYVSSSGGNDGTAVNYTPASPEVGNDPFAVTGGVMAYATIAAAYAQLRTGYPDILLLKRGDVFESGLGAWKKNGRSASERLIVHSYGASPLRPSLRLQGTSGMSLTGGGAAPDAYRWIIFSGFEMHDYRRDPANPAVNASLDPGSISLTYGASDLLFEDIRTKFVGIGLQGFGGTNNNCVLRRCVIADTYAMSGNVQGCYIDNTQGLCIEDCVFDHNGWNTEMSSDPTIFRHNLYIQNNCSGVTFRRNISARASSHGIQLRPGGTLHDNLFLYNPVNVLVGGGVTPNVGGVEIDITNNIVIGSGDIVSSARGTAIVVGNISSGAIVGNLIAFQSSTEDAGNIPIELSGTPSGSVDPTIGVNNLVISDNWIWNWRSPCFFNGGASITGLEHGKLFAISYIRNRHYEASSYRLLTLVSNAIDQVTSASNLFSSTASVSAWVRSNSVDISLTDYKTAVGDSSSAVWDNATATPVPQIDDYMASIGMTGTYEDFLAGAVSNSRHEWDTRFTAGAIKQFYASFLLA